MEFLKDPDGMRRIKLISSLLVSYLLSFLLFHYFFLEESPVLNPSAFQQIGQDIQAVQQGIRVDIFSSSNKNQISPAPSSVPNTGINTGPGEILPTSPVLPQPTVSVPTISVPTSVISPTYIPIVLPTSQPTTPPVLPTQPPAPTKSSANVSYADFGKCLNEKGMVMYMSATCGLCAQQKKTLKDAYNYIRAVDCNASQSNGLECSKVGVRGLPTWAKNGKAVFSGPQTIAALGTEAGCQVPTQ